MTGRLVIRLNAGASCVGAGLAAVTTVARPNVLLVLSMALIVGFLTWFAMPAQMALVPGLVRREDVPAAVALNSLTYNLARVIGPVVALLLIREHSIPWALAFNSASYLPLVVALASVRSLPHERTERGALRMRASIGVLLEERSLLGLLGVSAP